MDLEIRKNTQLKRRDHFLEAHSQVITRRRPEFPVHCWGLVTWGNVMFLWPRAGNMQHTHTHTQTHTLTHTHTHTHTYTHSNPHTRTQTHTHSHTLSHTHTHTHTHSNTLSHTYIHSNTYTLKHTLTHIHSHTHTHTHKDRSDPRGWQGGAHRPGSPKAGWQPLQARCPPLGPGPADSCHDVNRAFRGRTGRPVTPHKGLKCSCERSARPVIWAPEGTEQAVTVKTTGQGGISTLACGLGEEPEGLGSEGSPWGAGRPPDPRVSETAGISSLIPQAGQVAGWPAR